MLCFKDLPETFLFMQTHFFFVKSNTNPFFVKHQTNVSWIFLELKELFERVQGAHIKQHMYESFYPTLDVFNKP